MNKPTQIDVAWLTASYEEEAHMLAAFEADDVMEMGRLIKRRIQHNADLRVKTREAEKAKYRAEILAEIGGAA